MVFIIQFAKLPNKFIIDKSSNATILRKKYSFFRNDVIIHHESEKLFTVMDILNPLKYEQLQPESVESIENTFKDYSVSSPNSMLKEFVHEHPERLEKALKSKSGHKNGFLITVQGTTFFCVKDKGKPTPVYVVKEEKKNTLKALPFESKEEYSGEHDVVIDAIKKESLHQN